LHSSHLNIIVAGHVDHGKSTIVGRLLADTGSLPDGKIEQIRAMCERNSRPFEYAFLIDALKDERSQGITIDAARVFFKTEKRQYIIIDAPGHIEFLKNMVTGASRADAALLVIDASEGIQENSRRHGYMLSMLGIRQIAVIINKMDLAGFKKEVFDDLVSGYTRFLETIGIRAANFIPVSGVMGDAIAVRSKTMHWYSGPTVLETLDAFEESRIPPDMPLRFPVQDIYKFTKDNDTRRIIAGTVTSGTVSPGDEIVFYPSGKRSRVATIEAFNAPPPLMARAGSATGLTLQEQIFVTRGELAVKAGEPHPLISSRLRVSVFWMGRNPLTAGKNYLVKCGTTRTQMQVEEFTRVIDASDLHTLSARTAVDRHQVAECVLKLEKAIAFDRIRDIAEMGRFVIIDEFEIAGGGIILDSLEDQQMEMREKLLTRNIRWEKSTIPADVRAGRFNQKPALILITGRRNSGKKPLARALEKKLLDDGYLAYFLGIANVLYGVDADIKGIRDDRHEHIRRLAEVTNILLDTGLILIVTAIDIQPEEIELLRMTCNENEIHVVWLGNAPPGDMKFDLTISENMEHDTAIERILGMVHYTRE
jgi:bifunctional enzyme CysN/CysC